MRECQGGENKNFLSRRGRQHAPFLRLKLLFFPSYLFKNLFIYFYLFFVGLTSRQMNLWLRSSVMHVHQSGRWRGRGGHAEPAPGRVLADDEAVAGHLAQHAGLAPNITYEKMVVSTTTPVAPPTVMRCGSIVTVPRATSSCWERAGWATASRSSWASAPRGQAPGPAPRARSCARPARAPGRPSAPS
jgi:hypothetical protein